MSVKADISLEHHLVGILSDGTCLHAIDVSIENKGGVTIWEPETVVSVLHLDKDEACIESSPQTDSATVDLRAGGIEGIQPAETVVEHYRFKVPLDVEAFRVCVEVVSDRSNAWKRSLTIKNGELAHSENTTAAQLPTVEQTDTDLVSDGGEQP